MSQPASSTAVLARPSANPVSRARRWRLAVERLSIYMPAALMAMLALGSYWLLRSTPPAPEPVAERPLLHDPSDVMRRFSVRTHGLDGQLKSELLGQEARRFEDNGSMEVDQPRMRWFSPQGVLTTAQADLARTNADRDDYLLRGHADVVGGQRAGHHIQICADSRVHAHADASVGNHHIGHTLGGQDGLAHCQHALDIGHISQVNLIAVCAGS